MSLADEWIKKMWYIYTMEYYSAIKKNKIMSFATTLMQLELLILNEVRKSKTNTIAITYMWNLKYGTDEPVYRTSDSQT